VLQVLGSELALVDDITTPGGVQAPACTATKTALLLLLLLLLLCCRCWAVSQRWWMTSPPLGVCKRLLVDSYCNQNCTSAAAADVLQVLGSESAMA
jgi:hypothetical protein